MCKFDQIIANFPLNMVFAAYLMENTILVLSCAQFLKGRLALIQD